MFEFSNIRIIFTPVKLTLKIKLLPDDRQAKKLIDTIHRFNSACNEMSRVAFEKRKFNQVKLHHEVYYGCRVKYGLPSQLTVRAISKVVNSYKLSKDKKHNFRLHGAIGYDPRVLTYRKDSVSLITLDGREAMPFVCHRPDWLPYVKGEADLVFKKGKFYLLQTVEFPEDKVKDMDDFLGVDMGVVDIATLSTGESISSKWINEYRVKREKIRSSLQSKGTKGCKKLLKRLSGKERNTAALINHTISKRIVQLAIDQNKGIAIEDLTGIRKRSEKRVRKKQRGLRSKWSFYQLRTFIEYKAAIIGVLVVAIPPAYTSQTCSCCLHMGLRVGKSFTCKNCGFVGDADINAAINIATWGRTINRPGESNMFCSIVNHTSDSKPRCG